ncbi:peptidoglycan-binding domain-containing protein [Teredinibacter turnerae]|uniref:peptidoglycan-binding domain-containing protein n=1 Tax=Teredinibacter turnerae TaxID=2426 RepID=UPI0009B780F0
MVKIQRNLNALGYLVGAEDGILGSRTVTAIKQFQADTSVSVTGLPSYSLYVRTEASLAD